MYYYFIILERSGIAAKRKIRRQSAAAERLVIFQDGATLGNVIVDACVSNNWQWKKCVIVVGVGAIKFGEKCLW